MLLPIFGTDFGKGATRWYTLGFASVQPSEFLKPCFLVLTAWMISASKEINGPPGKLISFVIDYSDLSVSCFPARFWTSLFNLVWLVGGVFCGRSPYSSTCRSGRLQQ